MRQSDWLSERLAETPAELRRHLELAIDSIDGDLDIVTELMEAAVRLLESVRGRAGAREAAYDLLAADGLLTLACEAAAISDPDNVAERCRAMGPSGVLGELAARWAERN